MAAFLRLSAALFVLAFVPLTASGQSDTANKAGVMIDFGNDEPTYIVVPFEEESISSVELLERSGIPLLTVGFGGLGDAVCMIEIVGCEVSACRRTLCKDGKPDAPFWQFLQQPEGGSWTASPLGASSATVQDGDVDAWLWTGTLPVLQPLTLDTLVLQTRYAEDGGPAIFTPDDFKADDELDRISLVIGSGALALTVILGASLVLVQRRKRATASAR